MTKTNNSSNIIQGDLTTTLSTSGYCAPVSKFVSSFMPSSQTLTTAPTACSDLSVVLQEYGLYEITANIVEDISSVTASPSANYSTYQLYELGDQWTQQTGSGSRDWIGIHSSTTGQFLTAVDNALSNCYIYTNDNYGNGAWTARTLAGDRVYQNVWNSSDGRKIVAIENYIVINDNYGNGAWYVGGFTNSWQCIGGSYDGNFLIAGSGNGFIYTNTTGGSGSWVEQTQAGNRSWYRLDCSQNGSFIIACSLAVGGYVCTNTNYGSGAWYDCTGMNLGEWRGVACSSDGKYVAAVKEGGYIYTNTNYGSGNWVAQTQAGNRSWREIACSSNGKSLVACENGGYVYTNTNYGSGAWTEQTDAGIEDWWGVSISGDATRMAIGVIGGYIFTNTGYASISNSEKLGMRIPIFSSAIKGINIYSNSFSWIVNNNIMNNIISLYGKYNSAITGSWKVNSDANGRSYIYARLIA